MASEKRKQILKVVSTILYIIKFLFNICRQILKTFFLFFNQVAVIVKNINS